MGTVVMWTMRIFEPELAVGLLAYAAHFLPRSAIRCHLRALVAWSICLPAAMRSVETSGRVALIGGGGHAKVVIGALQAAGYVDLCIYDDDPARLGTRVLGVPVVGSIDSSTAAEHAGALLCIGNNAVRRKLAALRLPWMTLVHPRAWVHDSAQLGAGAVVFAGAVVQPEARIGEHAIVNTSASVDHECALGDWSQITPGVRLGGNVTVGEGAFLGVGAVAIPGVTIGAWAVIGAGAVVVRDVPERVVAMGVPATVRRAVDARR
jgi:sugar O-acyltransferase (sialic acid O-acetyltransferase NeuD family)